MHTNILDCESVLGITNCRHEQDVVVHCEGKQLNENDDLNVIRKSIYSAYCPEEITNTTRGNYVWPRTAAEGSLTASCVYGAVDGASTNIDQVRRNCSDRGVWIEVELDRCLTYSNSLLINITSVSKDAPSSNLSTIHIDYV